SFPQFSNMAVIDPDRRIVCSSIPAKVTKLQVRKGDDEIVERIRRTRDFVVGEVRSSAVDGRQVLPLVGPIFDDTDQIRYFFAAAIDIGWLNKEVSRLVLPNQAILLVLDRKGRVIARNPYDSEWIGEPAPPYEQGLPSQQEFTAEV